MSAGIHDRIVYEIVREVRVIPVTVKCELQNSCSRYVERISEYRHIRSYDSKVFGYERQGAQLPLDRAEEISAWARYPLATLSGGRTGWYMPGRRKTAEVVEPNHVYVNQQSP